LRAGAGVRDGIGLGGPGTTGAATTSSSSRTLGMVCSCWFDPPLPAPIDRRSENNRDSRLSDVNFESKLSAEGDVSRETLTSLSEERLMKALDSLNFSRRDLVFRNPRPPMSSLFSGL